MMNVKDKMEEMIAQQEYQHVLIFPVHIIVNVIMVILEMELLVSVLFLFFFFFFSFFFLFFKKRVKKSHQQKMK